VTTRCYIPEDSKLHTVNDNFNSLLRFLKWLASYSGDYRFKYWSVTGYPFWDALLFYYLSRNIPVLLVSYIRPWPLPSTTFRIHYSLIIPFSNAKKSQLLTAWLINHK
jgi:hypothetical protein